ncbi:MAG: hypothetical protein HY821_20595 [Acidobacteria bacterium]|nr:hypothetical protein [Acidobacteriota bacterium]
MGVASVQASTLVDKTDRTVVLRNINVTSVRFPSLNASDATSAEAVFRSLVPQGGETISLDRLLADLQNTKSVTKPVVTNNSPPTIFYSASPAVLVMVQGEPVLAKVKGEDIEYIVNTNWDIFFDKSSKSYFLLADTVWLTTKDLKSGWTVTKTLPKDLAKLPPNENWDDVRRMIPPPATTAPVPQVFFSSTPAELILFTGSPVYARIQGTRLLYATNTDNDLFLDNIAREFYILLSGRWFKSAALGGPWSYAGDSLPADFAKIPTDSPRARVLASVPGTIEASDAVLLAQVPTTAIVNRAEAEKSAAVTYVGNPQFKPIEQTKLEYAVNTDQRVIKDGDLYYLCFQGVWFMSTQATGPWKTADSVPPEIYTIPPSSPVYNVTYVYQTNPTSTTVECSHTAGYLGAMVIGVAAGFAIAYGTGFYYPPYMYWGPMYPYPIYHPWPATYGARAVYNPWTGGFAVGHAAYGPFAAAGTSAWYNPATGRYGRAASVQGWYGGRTAASAYNPWTGGYGHTVQGHNAYSQWGSSVATRGGQWVQSGHVATSAGSVAGFRTSTGRAGAVVRGTNGTVIGSNNHIYAGNDGNVYRHEQGGGWSRYGSEGWNQVHPSRPAGEIQSTPRGFGSEERSGLDRSAFSRSRGQFQTNRFHSFQRMGGRFRR